MFKKKFFCLLICFTVVFGFMLNVNAVTVKTGDRVYFNYSNKGKDNAKLKVVSSEGASCGTSDSKHCYTRWKFVKNSSDSGNWLYCTQLTNDFPDPSERTYIQSPYPAPLNPKALISGIALRMIDSKYSTKDERYLFGVLMLNRIFGFSNNKGAYAKATYSVALNTIYNNATQEYNQNYAKGCYSSSVIDPPSISVSSTVLNRKTVGNASAFISNPISLSKYKSEQCGKALTWKAYATANGGTTSICTDAAGNSCTNATATNPLTVNNTTFYVKVTGSNPSAVQVHVVGSSGQNSFPSVYEYYSDEESKAAKKRIVAGGSDNTYQIVMRKRNDMISYSSSLFLPFSVPETALSVHKVDDSGENLTGSTLSFYESNFDSSSNKCTTTKTRDISLTAGSNGFSWTSAQDLSLVDNKCYCVHESKAPTGYVLTDDTCAQYTNSSSGPKCWKSVEGASVETDINECGAHWKKCSDNENPRVDGNSRYCPMDPLNDPGSCSSGTVVTDGDHKGMCAVDDDPVLDENTNQMTCGAKEEVTVNEVTKCRDYVVPSCPNDYSWNGTSKTCEKEQREPAVCLGANDQPLSSTDPCSDDTNYAKVEVVNGSMSIIKYNYKTSVSVSKKDATGEDEIIGAVLKICDTKPDANGDCNPVTLTQKGFTCPTYSTYTDDTSTEGGSASSESTGSTESGSGSNCTYDEQTKSRTIKLIWTSDGFPRKWSGLEVGKTYYIVEDIPPTGYVSVTTSTEFVIQPNGNVKVGKKELLYDKDVLVINNQLSKITISKADLATSKEVPGATLVVYYADVDDSGNWSISKNEKGEELIAVKQDGEFASWTSTNEPYVLEGLPIGDYILVEFIAPKGYSTAESIPFSLKKDGTLTDKNGKSLKDSKIVMYDKSIKDVKTGSLGTYIIALLFVLALVGGAGSYYFLKKRGNQIA